MPKKIAVTQRPMVVDSYALLRDSVGQGVILGWNRAHKHTDEPGEYVIKDTIENAVLECITEYFTFPEVKP